MPRHLRLVLPAFALITAMSHAAVTSLTWDTLPALPPAAGQTVQPGVASPFVGVQGDVLIVAGGANFPGERPWDGGAKVWWDDIWVLENFSRLTPTWVRDRTFKLPRRIAYGISVSMPEGVVCVGGNDAERCYADVFLLSWDAGARTVRTTPLPPLPEPLTNMAGALVGRTLYVAGGQHVMKGAVPTTVFWALDFSKREQPAGFQWVKLPPWPGPARVLAVAAAQGPPRREKFYLFSGRLPQPGGATRLLSDAYEYDPLTRVWRTLAPVGGLGLCVMAGTAAPFGSDEVLVFGGDRGELFLKLEAHDLAIEGLRQQLAGATAPERAALEREIENRLETKRPLLIGHPGFAREVLAYDTRRDAWRVVALSPFEPQVTTLAVKVDGYIIIPSGEIRPGIRTPEVVRVRPMVSSPR